MPIDRRLEFTDLAALSTDEALAAIASLVDASLDARSDAAAERALALVDELRRRELSVEQETLLWYFVGNAWANRRIIGNTTTDHDAIWQWENPTVYQEVLAFRRARSSAGFVRVGHLRRCQILTNLGNLMSNLGRFVEALDYYDLALGENPAFGMALANRAQCLLSYARALYDRGHQVVLASEVTRLLDRARQLPLEPGTHERFAELQEVARLESSGSRFAGEPERLRAFELGEGEEGRHRRWALERRLFLNPLNDMGPLEIAARDPLHLPEVRVAAHHGTGFHGFYNQLKQEFAAARVLLFESEGAQRHYADRDLRLVDTLDETTFGLSVEKTKLAFRSAYSILDKVGVFIALYFAIAVPLHRVSVRSVWFADGRADRGLRPEFANRKNWPLRGLYWLAKDLAEDDAQLSAAMEPDAQATATLRNRLEHQYVKVSSPSALPDAVPPDPFAYRVEREQLAARALRMVKTARAALIYLSLAVHAEERQRTSPPDGPGTVHGDLPILE